MLRRIARLLSEDERRLCDVVLDSRDSIKIPANRALLALSSNYLKDFLYRDGGLIVEAYIDCSYETLRFVLEGAYTGEVRVFELLTCNNEYEREVDLRRANDNLPALLDLIVAAHRLKIPLLETSCIDVMRRILIRFPELVCKTLHMIDMHNSSNYLRMTMFMIFEHVVDQVDIRECFGVPDCVFSVTGRSQRGTWRDDGLDILSLSSKTLGEMLDGVFDSEDQEYLLQVIYYWGTSGEILPCSHASLPARKRRREDDKATPKSSRRVRLNDGRAAECVVDRHEDEEDERWQEAKDMIKYVTLDEMRAEFLQEFVERSGLVSLDELYAVYKRLAMKGSCPLQYPIAVNDGQYDG